MAFRGTWLAMVLAVGCGEVHGTMPDATGGGGSGSGSGGCEASAPLRCDGTSLVSCNADGTGETQTACDVRCNATSLKCENQVVPSNGFASQLATASGEPALSTTTDVNAVYPDNYNAGTGTLQVGTQQVKAALVTGTNGAPDVLVLSVGALGVAAGTTLVIGGQPGTPAVAIMSAGDVTINGTLRVTNMGSVQGNDPCRGANASAAGADNDNPGGGGGGFGGAGGKGGDILAVGTGGAGGTTSGNATLIPLRGGCAGGRNAFGGLGEGGGALQITSPKTISIAGAITAPGLGGAVSTGGGSGGGILLEAPTVTITGGVYANGGGGGCGNLSGAGQPGQPSTTPAVGDFCNGVHGGSGGAGTTAAGNGDAKGNASGTQDYAGGGGGGVGRIRINTRDMTVAGSGKQSPSASLGPIAAQ